MASIAMAVLNTSNGMAQLMKTEELALHIRAANNSFARGGLATARPRQGAAFDALNC